MNRDRITSTWIEDLSRPVFWCACLAVTILSLLPAGELPPRLFDWWDKGQHFVAFMTLSLLGLTGYSHRSPWTILAGLLTLGIGIELAQYSLGWRHGDYVDVVADTLGIAAGALFLGSFRRTGAN